MASDIVGSWVREDNLIEEDLAFEEGFVATPIKPGLGCEMDRVAVEGYSKGYEVVS